MDAYGVRYRATQCFQFVVVCLLAYCRVFRRHTFGCDKAAKVRLELFCSDIPSSHVILNSLFAG
jgi:hypothetical protein